MRKKKNKLYKNAQYSNCDKKWCDYRNYKNKYKKEIESKQYQFIQKKLDKVRNDSKGTWKVLKSLYNNQSEEISEIEVSGVKIEEKEKIANEFNEFLVNSIEEINQSIPFAAFDRNLHINCENVFNLKTIDVNDLYRHLRSMNNKKDNYGISADILIDALPEIGSIFCGHNQ